MKLYSGVQNCSHKLLNRQDSRGTRSNEPIIDSDHTVGAQFLYWNLCCWVLRVKPQFWSTTQKTITSFLFGEISLESYGNTDFVKTSMSCLRLLHETCQTECGTSNDKTDVGEPMEFFASWMACQTYAGLNHAKSPPFLEIGDAWIF